MATIISPKLAIEVGLPGGKSKVEVKCQLKFSPFEMFSMSHGVRFRLECKLWGADAWPNPDDSLYSFTRKMYPDTTPSATENVIFTATIPSSVLNEDDSIFDRTDEVYAALTLTNLETGVKITTKSNEIVHHF